MKVVGLLLIVLAVEGALWGIWGGMGAATEACNTGGETGWLCDVSLARAIRVAVITVPIVALSAAGIVLITRGLRQPRD